MGILDDEFSGGGIVPTNPIRPRPRPIPPQWTPPQDIPETPNLKPGKPDIGLEEKPELDEGSSGYVPQGDGFTDVRPLTDDQRFMVIGLAVLAGIFGFMKK